jgi:hypothetical protein
MRTSEMQATVGGFVAPTGPVNLFKVRCIKLPFLHRRICFRVRVPMSNIRF